MQSAAWINATIRSVLEEISVLTMYLTLTSNSTVSVFRSVNLKQAKVMEDIWWNNLDLLPDFILQCAKSPYI